MAINLNPVIFLSYSWANVNTADEIDNDFKSIGIQFRRDVRDAPYRTSIKEFMQQIGKSDFVLMIISDEYLKSENCMYEVTELLNTHEFEKRILPVLLDNVSSVFKAQNRLIYYDYWKDQLKKANQLKKKHPNQDYIDLVKRITNINGYLDVFFQKITDMNLSTYKKLKVENYSVLLKIVGISNKYLLEKLIGIIKIKDTEEQELELDKFLKEHPDNKYAWGQKGYLAQESKLYKKAKIYYEEAIRIDSNFANAHYNLGILFKNEFFDFEKAKEHFERAIQSDNNYMDSYVILANLLKKHFSDFEKAKYYYEKAILIDPHNELAHYNFANLLVQDFSLIHSALEHYEETIRINPQNASAFNNLGILFELKFSEFEKAKAYFEKAISLDPKLEEAHYNLANILISKFNNFKAAKLHYEEVLSINPKHESAHYNLGLLFEIFLSDFKNAGLHYKETLTINSQNQKAKDSLANIIKMHLKN